MQMKFNGIALVIALGVCSFAADGYVIYAVHELERAQSPAANCPVTTVLPTVLPLPIARTSAVPPLLSELDGLLDAEDAVVTVTLVKDQKLLYCSAHWTYGALQTDTCFDGVARPPEESPPALTPRVRPPSLLPPLPELPEQGDLLLDPRGSPVKTRWY
jgi:hypothetical protein